MPSKKSIKKPSAPAARTSAGFRDRIMFQLNGELKEVGADDGLMTLAEWLRKRAGKPGTKIVCAEGDCGACTVLRMNPLSKTSGNQFQSVNSCIATVAQMDGCHLVTIEGIALDGALSPAQQKMKECHGSQCGFCTPGFVMAFSGALESKNKLSAREAANCATGNLCRCTGYAPIIDAAASMRSSPAFSLKQRYLTPAHIKTLKAATTQELKFTTTTGHVFYAPRDIKSACAFLTTHENARILSGGTDLGVQHNKGKPIPRGLLSLHAISDLYPVTRTTKSLRIGAMASLEDLRLASEAILPELAGLLNVFASPQIKHAGTLAGNLANASPIGDTIPFLLACDALIHVTGKNAKTRQIPVTELYNGYKSLTLKKGEIMTSVEIPLNPVTRGIRFFKVSQREDLDISTVSLAIHMAEGSSQMISKTQPKASARARLAVGGVAATPIRLPKTEEYLNYHPLSADTWKKATEILQGEITPIADLRGSAAYRRVVLDHLMMSCYATLSGQGDVK